MSDETDPGADGAPAAPAWDALAHYHNRLAQMDKDVDAALAGDEPVMVLLGDSISEGHPATTIAGHRVVNMGISGDKIAMEPDGGVLRRIGVVARARPAHVFLMIGVNDFWHTPPKPLEAARQDYARVAAALTAAVPGARVWFLSTFPTGGEKARMMADIRPLNDHVRELAARHGATFVDMGAHLGDERGELRGELTGDGVHLTPAGYAVWTRELERLLARA